MASVTFLISGQEIQVSMEVARQFNNDEVTQAMRNNTSVDILNQFTLTVLNHVIEYTRVHKPIHEPLQPVPDVNTWDQTFIQNISNVDITGVMQVAHILGLNDLYELAGTEMGRRGEGRSGLELLWIYK